MTIHYLPTALNTKVNDITTSLTEIVDKLDLMAKEMKLGHGLSGNFEIECSAFAGTINIGNAPVSTFLVKLNSLKFVKTCISLLS